MNGLGGGYSQILINSRPVFSPLTGLYGMEQLPANMVEQVEIVRGGGSALYGSSAIGGTVNIITKIPSESSYDLSSSVHSINDGAMENYISGNVSMITRHGNAGASVFVSRRFREAYDHNGDDYSELPELRTNSFGANLFFKPAYNQKLELNFSSLKEYRYGGEMINDAAFQAQQSEERSHDVLMGGLDYQINFNDENSSLIAYLAGQNTNRKHYTGVMPDDSAGILSHFADPPYGHTLNSTLMAGMQLNHRLRNFPGADNVITAGVEYMYDDVFDTIPSYRYEVDQVTGNIAGFLQSDWKISQNFTFLAGIRADKHNLVDHVILSPRLSALYRLKNYMQLRLTWGTGFRAPQAFDADMHIAFSGGGISRISLDPDLREERSNSLSTSVNYDKATESFVAGFTLEGFYTRLINAFYLQPIGQDEFGDLFEKRNGSGATVQGMTIELRGNYRRKAQLEGGFTLQTSLHDDPVYNIEGLDPKREFLRTPGRYGYLILSFTPNRHIDAALNAVYTGPMYLAHFAGAPEQDIDEYVISKPFTELGLKFGYTFIIGRLDSGIELFGGLKNILNSYQDDFDTGKSRDSNYVYGPAAPRTVYVGLRLRSF
jgi:outer membrane receptor for ferrienterochelin and colicins